MGRKMIRKTYVYKKILTWIGICLLCVGIVSLSGCGNRKLEQDTVDVTQALIDREASKNIELPETEEDADSSTEDLSDDSSEEDSSNDADSEEDTDMAMQTDNAANTEATTTEASGSSGGSADTTAASNTGSGTEAGTTSNSGTESVTEATTAVQAAYYVDDYANQVLTLINVQRTAEGLTPLTMNTTLLSAAQVRAQELTQNFSHTRPDGSSCFTAINVSYSTAGENIAAGQWSPEWVVESWMNSEGHRANIMNAGYTQVAIACYYDPNSAYGYYWVQIFIG